MVTWWHLPTVTQDEECFPYCCSPDGRASLHKALPIVINGGPDVRFSANSVEGKGQEMTYNLQSLKGAWVAKRDQSDTALCTTEVWSWPLIAL